MQRGSETVLLGKVVGTHGIRGQLRIVLFSGEFSSLEGADSIILKRPGGMETFAVSSVSRHGAKVLVALKGYDSINQVLGLVGCELYVRRNQLPVLEDGEYYWCDLIGLRVVTDKGEELGTLTDIIATGSNDVYVVTSGQREYLVPALEDVVREINLNDGTMKVSPLEGLFDL